MLHFLPVLFLSARGNTNTSVKNKWVPSSDIVQIRSSVFKSDINRKEPFANKTVWSPEKQPKVKVRLLVTFWIIFQLLYCITIGWFVTTPLRRLSLAVYSSCVWCDVVTHLKIVLSWLWSNTLLVSSFILFSRWNSYAAIAKIFNWNIQEFLFNICCTVQSSLKLVEKDIEISIEDSISIWAHFYSRLLTKWNWFKYVFKQEYFPLRIQKTYKENCYLR